MSIFPKLIYRFNAIAIKIYAGFLLVELNKLILKFTEKYEGPRMTKAMMKKEKRTKPEG